MVTSVSSALLIGATTGVAGAAPPTNLERAQRGAQWLANEIEHDGGILVNFGKPDPVDTAYAVIGLRATGVDKVASDQAIAALKGKVGTDLQTGGHDSPGAIAEYVMAAVADGQDARHFGGTATRNDLVSRLLASGRTKGTDKGLFGAADPSFDGTFRQGLALAALAAVHVPATDPRVTAGLAWLAKQQCANGLWEAYRANPATTCPAANPKTFTGPDTNSTAFAVEGLAAWGRFPRRSSVLHALKAIQTSDGGFPFVAAPNLTSDPDSTGLVIQALLAEKSSPAGALWKKSAHTPYTALAGYQLGCSDSGFGAFEFPGSNAANVFATVQSVPAMAGKTLPVAPSSASTVLGLKPC